MKDGNAVIIKEFSLSFIRENSKSALDVLDKIDLEVPESKIVVILGPSGCGKTTLLKSIGGLQSTINIRTHYSGVIEIFGNTPIESKKSHLFGFAFQNPVLLPWRTVYENVVLPLELIKAPNKYDHQAVDEMLELMEVNDFNDSFPHELSGGMKQRVNIARSLIHQPKVLLMDEPFGSLDEITRERLNFVFHKIQRLKKTTVFFITHSIREAALLGDIIVILSRRPARVKEIIVSPLPSIRKEEIISDKIFLDFVLTVKMLFLKGDRI